MQIIPYNRDISKLLLQASLLCSQQYELGVIDPSYDGYIENFDIFKESFCGYTQRASFKAKMCHVEAYIGLTMTSASSNILAFGGTAIPEEWVGKLTTDLSDDNQLDKSPIEVRGKVHLGLEALYNSFADLVRNAAREFEPNVHCYVTGYSLGGVLAVFAAIDIALNVSELKSQVQMYSYEGLPVGDPDSVEFYNEVVPNSYRVVNLADAVPNLLPAIQLPKILQSLGGYQHVGQECSFLD